MVEKSITRRRRERENAAIRSARWRETHADRPDVRSVDKALSEAVALYSRTLPPEAAKSFLEALVTAASAGLVFQGFASPQRQVALRLQSWLSGMPTSGGVRAATEGAVTPTRAYASDRPVTSSYAATPSAIA